MFCKTKVKQTIHKSPTMYVDMCLHFSIILVRYPCCTPVAASVIKCGTPNLNVSSKLFKTTTTTICLVWLHYSHSWRILKQDIVHAFWISHYKHKEKFLRKYRDCSILQHKIYSLIHKYYLQK